MNGINIKLRSGFTLTELMAVIAIAAILMAIGVPSYRYVSASYRMSSEVNGLLGDLQFARSEAIKEGQPVTVCVSTDGASCANGVARTRWHNGWIVFSDPNGNAKVDAGEAVLRIQAGFSGKDTFQDTASSKLDSVTFNREGFAVGLPNAGVTLTLHDSTGNAAFTRCLAITLVGMMTTQTHATAATCI